MANFSKVTSTVCGASTKLNELLNKVKIIDSRGRIMKDYKMSDGIEIPSHWPSGSYFIKIDDKTFKFFLTK